MMISISALSVNNFNELLLFFCVSIFLIKASQEPDFRIKDTSDLFNAIIFKKTAMITICGYKIPIEILNKSFNCLSPDRLAQIQLEHLPGLVKYLILNQFDTTHALDLSLKGCAVRSFLHPGPKQRLDSDEMEIAYLGLVYRDYQEMFFGNSSRRISISDLPKQEFRKTLSELDRILDLKVKK